MRVRKLENVMLRMVGEHAPGSVTVQDDRSPEERATHTVLVVMNDRFLSGWGGAAGGVSVAAWACRPEHADRVEARVRARSDAKRVRVVTDSPKRRYRPGGNAAHLHIYVVDADHPYAEV